jgi:gluconolactonase
MVAPLPVPQGEPAAKIDLMTDQGVAACKAEWRYSDVTIVESTNTLPGPDRNTPGPEVKTYDISPRAGEANFDDSQWPVIAPASLKDRRAAGKICFNWYRIKLTMPEQVDGVNIAGMTAVLHCTVDDYAEVWVNGVLPRSLSAPSPNLVQGFNLPNRVTIAQEIKPGDEIQIAIFGMNGPISAAPTNYIFFRDARVEFHSPAREEAKAPERGPDQVIGS